MSYDPERHHRRSIRLRGYDYAQAGYYFVTMVAHQRACLFGEIADGQMRVSACGEIVQEEWTRSPQVRAEIDLDVFMVMPNHLHGIVVIRDDVGAHGRAPLPPGGGPRRAPRSLGSLVAGFKSAVTKRVNEVRGTPRLPVWQRSYYERVIRNERELEAIRQYIVDNPTRWAGDAENPANVGAHGRAPLQDWPP